MFCYVETDYMIAGPPMSFGMMKGNDTTLFFLLFFIQNFSSLSRFGQGHYGVNKIKLHRFSVSTSQAITFMFFFIIIIYLFPAD